MRMYATGLLWYLALTPALAQSIAPRILNQRWDAHWIATPGQPATDYGVYHFRKTIELPQKPDSFVVHVSADNRYKLYANGALVSLGPARGDLFHWNFETVDLAPYLRPGKNTLAAVVWNFGQNRPMAQVSTRTAFIVQGNTDREKVVNTDQTWRSLRDAAYTELPPDLNYTYYVAGPGERVNYQQYPWGWETPDFDDGPWQVASAITRGTPKYSDWSESWLLVPRAIPPMELTPQRLPDLRSCVGMPAPTGFPAQPRAFTVPANADVTLLLDQTFLTNAYPTLVTSGGKGASVSMAYAEALFVPDAQSQKDWKLIKQKGNRNEVAGKRFVGVGDEVIADGGSKRTYTGLWFRTYRYVQVRIRTQAQPLTVDDFYGTFTGYPFERRATLQLPDPEVAQMMDVGWRTARLCAGETYYDCPYYEQLQYAGDARIQALVSLYNSGDDRLVRNAIAQLDYSRLAEGITQSRYPSHLPQQIPPFSLWWIGMLHDYWRYRPDADFVRQKLPGVRQVLQFFANYQQPDGALRAVPYWNFTDWCEAEGWKDGRAPRSEQGYSSAQDLQLLWAYQLAAELEAALGMPAFAEQYRARAAQLAATVRQLYWDEGRQLFADTPDHKLFSQHANVLAVLTGVVQGAAARQLVERTLADTSLAQCTIYFKHYLHAAVAAAGLGDRYPLLLSDWRTQLNAGLTTWAEISDVNRARSDCHAWGASPNVAFFRITLGIDSDAPGFARVRIAPNLGTMKTASGSLPHPNGTLSVSYAQSKRGQWAIRIGLPPRTNGTLVWQGREYSLKPGENVLAMP